MTKTGLLMPGFGGAIATTVSGVIDLIKQGHVKKYGMISEKPIDDRTLGQIAGAPEIEELEVGGWDAVDATIGDAMKLHGVLEEWQYNLVSPNLKLLRAWPVRCPDLEKKSPWGSCIAQICNDIETFRKERGVDSIVLVNCISTMPKPTPNPAYESISSLQVACQQDDPCITPSMQYAIAAALTGSAYANFTPNPVEVPSIVKLAQQHNTPLAGHDGKTGQTLLKTGIAPMFNIRNLRVRQWISYNHLGNRDGAALAEPNANQTKITSKANCLTQILGYEDVGHKVTIDYVPHPDGELGDRKQAIDHIRFKGFGDTPMSLLLHFDCQDSSLAGGIVVDLARFMTVSLARKESGLQPQYGLFFKSPQVPNGEPDHDLFNQAAYFEAWVCQDANQ
ncbi:MULTISPECIES: inositol-3-phosphate synthase [unclassified Moorena]|uniref:inositol-3-phosphate synthase n=2 Tax=Moorena TaxID=1155738 RepID=UPI0014005EE9|nr:MULTISPECIES: inositol-3-phosphate synthase [unclassified Moorena]NEO12362.1 hypothetical protein [Moorena sp. SIO3E8]NEP99348.1 hypothetical protein [Moorena sp. SIO3F7]